VWFCMCALFSLVTCILSCSRSTCGHALLSVHMAQPALSCTCVQWNWWPALGQCRLHGGLLHSHQDRVCLLPPNQLCHTHVPINHHSECSRVSVNIGVGQDYNLRTYTLLHDLGVYIHICIMNTKTMQSLDVIKC